MGTCAKCGKEIVETASFCPHCGENLKKGKSKSQFEQNIEDFSQEMEHIGKKIERSFDRVGASLDTWYERTFGIVGPLLSGLIGFIITFIIIQAFGFFGSTYPWMGAIHDFADPLLIYILPIILISSYSNYLAKKYVSFRLISPIIGALVFVFWFWIGNNILAILGSSWNRPFFISLSNVLEFLIIPIAFLILLLGYVGVFFSSKPKPKASPNVAESTKQEESKTMNTETGEYKRLYRSGKDKMVAGVLGGLAEYLNVDPTIIRVVFVILLIASMGFMILAYLISWILIPRNPSHAC